MTADPKQVRALFFAALDEDVPDEALDDWLSARSEDEAIREEVASLLAFHDDEDLVQPGGVTVTSLHDLPAADGTAPRPTETAKTTLTDARYRELSELGVGGCGRVTRAWDAALKREVALKTLLESTPSLRAQLLQEARLLAWLDHPGVVPVHDVSREDGGCSYSMRVVSGRTLRERIDAEGTLPVRDALRIVTRIAETLANAHAKGVLHLDLKPDNIMLMDFGQVCVLDWGVARFHDLGAYQAFLGAAGDEEPPSVAGYAGVAGTPDYMPVEQVAGEVLTPAADVFACGTVLYEMLVGSLPFETRGSALGVLRKAMVEVVPPRSRRADLPAGLDTLCLRMLAADPDARPASFEEVLATLDAMSSGGWEAEDRVLQPGEVLFHEGEPGTEAFQILSGEVAVTVHGAHGPVELARRGVGDLIGEMAVISGSTRSATVTAQVPTRVAVVTGAVIERALQGADPLVAQMLRSTVARLRQEAERGRQDP